MIVLNEREFAETCIKNNVMPDKPFPVLNIIAKYYYTVNGLRGKKLVAAVLDYMKTAGIGTYKLNPDYWADEVIPSICNKAKNQVLREDRGVWITHSELDSIRALKNSEWERVAFTLLCLAKLGDMRKPTNAHWVNTPWAEIFKMARVNLPRKQRNYTLHELYIRNMIGAAKRVDNLNLKILYVGDDEDFPSPANGDVLVDDFRDLGNFYRMISGENYTRCQECGAIMKDNARHTKKYCDKCVHYEPQTAKKVVCVDCGKEFEVPGSNKRTVRCSDCQKIYSAKKHKERQQKYRDRQTA